MLDWLKKTIATESNAPVSKQETGSNRIHIAICALMLEMAHSDGEFSEEERNRLFGILQREFNLSKTEVEEIEVHARQDISDSIDHWQFTNLINQHYDTPEKIRVVELLWKIVYTDGHLNEHEDYLVHKFADLLNIEHRDLIAAKMRVLKQ